MKKTLSAFFTVFFVLMSFEASKAQETDFADNWRKKTKKILVFNPEVYPEVTEIKEPTYTSFFSAVSDKMQSKSAYKMIRIENSVPFDAIDSIAVREYAQNNSADFVLIPKVRYFKVGIGNYVFSNQVVVQLKLYDSIGNFILASDYDTFRKNARILGSAENSVKIGSSGALKNLLKKIKKLDSKSSENSSSKSFFDFF